MVKRIAAGGSSGEPPPAADPAQDTGPQGLAELASLAAAAERVESGQAPDAAPKAPAEPTPTDHRAACREVVEVAASLLLPLVAWRWGDAVADLYGPPQLARIGDALGDVAAKRGWSLDELLQGYGPELALAAALMGPAMPLLVARAKAAREAREAPESAARPAAVVSVPPPPPATPPSPPVTPHDGSAPARY